MSADKKRVAFSDPDYDLGDEMQFRLTYQGTLLSTGNDTRMGGDKRADHKHDIRLAFHPQLKRLWEITPFLKSGERSGPSALILESSANTPSYKASWLAKKHVRGKWGFIPLVSQALGLLCAVDILFLRPSIPGSIVKSGDIDGRLKTLLDALAMPDGQQGYEARDGEMPMYVLLEDDKLITKVSVETDQLLEAVTPQNDPNDVRLFITVTIRPHEMHLGNMQFG